MNKADRERVEDIRSQTGYGGSWTLNAYTLEDLLSSARFLLSIIDKQDKVVEAAKGHWDAAFNLCPYMYCDICDALKELEGENDEPS